MPGSSKGFLNTEAFIECGFTLKRVRDMTRTYSQELNMLLTYRGPATLHDKINMTTIKKITVTS